MPFRISDATGASSGTGASTATAPYNGYIEMKNLTTGTTTTGGSVLSLEQIPLPNPEKLWVYYGANVNDLSTVAEEFIFEFGILDGTAGATSSDGVYFRYDRLTSTNWYAVTEASSTETTTDTGVAVVADADDNFLIYTDVAGTEVKYYINDALVATHTTNIPTATNMVSRMRIQKSAGTTSRTGRWMYHYAIISRV
jgi:hypothetical protein